MKILSGFFVAMSLFTQVAIAQNSKVTTAANAIYAGEYDKAKTARDEAILNEKTKNEAKTWLYRGRVCNLIALDTTGKYASIQDPIGTALESFKTALQMPDVKNYKKDIASELFTTYNLFFARGATAYNAGNSEEAYQYFSKAQEANNLQIDADPTAALDSGVIFNVGLMAERTNRIPEAIAAYQRLVDIKYSESYLYSKLSNLYMTAGRNDDALKVLESGRTNFPQDKDIMISELNFYLAQNRLNELVTKLETAISLDPKNAELYFVLGTTHGELIKLDSVNSQSHFDAAIKAYNQALSIDNNRFDVNLNAGALYYNTAIEINKQMNALPLEKEAEYQRLLGVRNKLYMDALPYFENAHRIDPKNTDCMLALKEIYVRTEQKDKADAIKKEMGN